MKKLLFLLPIVALMTSCGGGKDTEGSAKEVKLAHTLPQSHSIHKAYERFAEIVKEKSGGKYNVVVYADAQLGSQTSTIRLAQSGGLEFVHMNVGILEGFNDIFTLLNLPFIFKDYEHFRKVMDHPDMRDLYNELTPIGFTPLTYLEGGARSMYTKRPITVPADMKGLKIRVMESPTHIEMINRLGGSAVAMAPSEIYTALQSGVIDGAENNSTTFLAQRHSEITKYYSLTEHMRLSDILSVGGPFWAGLSAEDQKMFIDSAIVMSEEFAEVWAEGEAAADAGLLAEDVIFHPVANQNDFRQLVLPMHEAYASRSPEHRKWLEFVRALEN